MAQEVAEQAARRYSRNAAAAVAIDSLLQNSGRREHDYATWRIRHLVAGLRIAADRLVFLDFSRHSYVFLAVPQSADRREMRMRQVEVVAHLGELAFRGSPILQVSPL